MESELESDVTEGTTELAGSDMDAALLLEMEALTDEVGSDEVVAPAGEEPSADLGEDLKEDLTEVAAPESPADTESSINDRNLESLQRRDKKQHEALAADRTALEEDIAKFKAERTEHSGNLDQFNEMRELARYDPVGVLKSLGLSPEQYETAARALYSQRPGATADPQTEQVLKSRKTSDQLTSLADEVKSLRAEIAQKEESAAVEASATEFVSKTAEHIGDGSPIIGKLFKANPGRFASYVHDIAGAMWKETGERPLHVDVLKKMEHNMVAELKELGIETQAVAPEPPKTPKPTPGTSTKPTNDGPVDMSEDELLEDVLSGLSGL